MVESYYAEHEKKVNQLFDDYCGRVALVCGLSFQEVQEKLKHIKWLSISSWDKKSINEGFLRRSNELKELAEEKERVIGNKRNGMLDRRQAFGGLF